MSLTKVERDFLDAYVYEATHEPFGGPATEDLRRHGIYYADLHGLLMGYHRELRSDRILPFGKHNPSPPPTPWANRQEAERRNRAILDALAQQPPGRGIGSDDIKHADVSKSEMPKTVQDHPLETSGRLHG